MAGFSGSIRRHSFSTAILQTLADAVAERAETRFCDIGAMPHYNQDQDGPDSPPVVAAMRETVAGSDGLLIVLSEFNHGVPGVLKNTFDWLSRPAFKSCLKGKPALIVTSSVAFTGGVRAQYQMRETLFSALARPFPTHEIVIGNVRDKITGDRLTDAEALRFSLHGLNAFLDEISHRP